MGSLDQYFLICLTAFLAKSREITLFPLTVRGHIQLPGSWGMCLVPGGSFLRMHFVRAIKPKTISVIINSGSLFFIGIS